MDSFSSHTLDFADLSSVGVINPGVIPNPVSATHSSRMPTSATAATQNNNPNSSLVLCSNNITPHPIISSQPTHHSLNPPQIGISGGNSGGTLLQNHPRHLTADSHRDTSPSVGVGVGGENLNIHSSLASSLIPLQNHSNDHQLSFQSNFIPGVSSSSVAQFSAAFLPQSIFAQGGHGISAISDTKHHGQNFDFTPGSFAGIVPGNNHLNLLKSTAPLFISTPSTGLGFGNGGTGCSSLDSAKIKLSPGKIKFLLTIALGKQLTKNFKIFLVDALLWWILLFCRKLDFDTFACSFLPFFLTICFCWIFFSNDFLFIILKLIKKLLKLRLVNGSKSFMRPFVFFSCNGVQFGELSA